MPTGLPSSHRPGNSDFNGLGVVAWAAPLAVVAAMFIAGAIYWSGLGNEATRHAQSIGSSAVLKDVTRDVDSAVQ